MSLTGRCQTSNRQIASGISYDKLVHEELPAAPALSETRYIRKWILQHRCQANSSFTAREYTDSLFATNKAEPEAA